MNPAALPTLDAALRGGLVALMLFAAALVWREHGRVAAGRLAVALAVGVAAYAVQSAPGFLSWPPVARLPLAVLSTGNAVVFWLFARALFDDEFRWRPWHAVAWCAMALLSTVGCFARAQAMPAITLATLGFAVLAVVQTLASWRADLVEKRRRLRVFIVGAGALYTAVNMGARLLGGEGRGAVADVIDMAALSAIATVVAWHLVRPASGQLFARGVSVAEPVAAEADDASLTESIDNTLIAALEHQMMAERAYRQEGLTIGALARQLGVPEYRLRRTINQGLGYRNFNAFLNRYRLAQVKAALGDPAQAGVPVLTLALDAGFQSIGPFNRAFKAETGVTPTEFRRGALGG
ncbi:MAG TPA: helix-turn-helix domain-containing protein [Rhizobacter sp.]|nr:helix-turn-helix domain-containing protein [Rhizobacter sp.]